LRRSLTKIQIDMKTKYYLLWLMFTFCSAVSAQNRVTVKKVVMPTLYNMSAEQRQLLGIEEESFFLNKSWRSAPFYTAFVYAKGHMFQIDGDINLSQKDINKVYVNVTFKDLSVSEPILGAYIETKAKEWIIPLKEGKGSAHFKKGIFCTVPLAPRGKELFLHADAHIDLRDETKSTIIYKIKEEKVNKPFLYEKWPTKDEFQNKMWLKYKDSEGNTHQLYLYGKEKIIAE